MTKNKSISITQIKSAIGYRKKTKDTLKALGLKKMNQTVEKKDTPSIRGMINKISHLLKVKEK
jgi:large subunit ribosomal protein L30